tara:strand:+ start:241 stop:441 length:201 start_codon:yes stop_codon:yes gene_type:complete
MSNDHKIKTVTVSAEITEQHKCYVLEETLDVLSKLSGRSMFIVFPEDIQERKEYVKKEIIKTLKDV